MNDREYIIKEVRSLYRFILGDKEKFKEKKHLYARIYNSLENILECEAYGIENISLSKEEIKDIIKEEIEKYNKSL